MPQENQEAMTKAFTKHEKEAFEHLAKAVAAFQRLEPSHPSHRPDFVDGIHKCQQIIGQRLLQREQPYIFATYARAGRQPSWLPVVPQEISRKGKFLKDGRTNPHYEGE